LKMLPKWPKSLFYEELNKELILGWIMSYKELKKHQKYLIGRF
jgi:hypothetical protein